MADAVKVYDDRTEYVNFSDRMKRLRKEIDKLPPEKAFEIAEHFMGFGGSKGISTEEKLNILFTEMSDEVNAQGLIYIGDVEKELEKIKSE